MIDVKQKMGTYFSVEQQERIKKYVEMSPDGSIVNLTTLTIHLLDIAEGKAQPSTIPVVDSKEYTDMVDKYETDLHKMGRELFDAIGRADDLQVKLDKPKANKSTPTPAATVKQPTTKQVDKSNRKAYDDSLSFAW